mmetsp:Transcript_94573/g.210220  ORF Transcript_94573/g.210220 Transcript_94573/m.210220 type:complete len:154 (-) Transcript_94573:54-515(-)
MGLFDCCDHGFEASMQQLRYGPCLLMVVVSLYHLLIGNIPLNFIPVFLSGNLGAVSLLLISTKETDWIIGRIAKPIKDSIEKPCASACGYLFQTLIAWGLLVWTFLAAGGDDATSWAIISTTLGIIEATNIFCLPLVFCFRIVCRGKKVMKQA